MKSCNMIKHACDEMDKNTVLLKRTINNYHSLKEFFPKRDPEFAVTDDPCKSLAALMELGTPENTHEIPTIGTPCQ